MDDLDKNRYAGAAEAELLREQLRTDEEAKRALQGPKTLAHQALLAAQQALAGAQSHYDGLIELEDQIDLRIRRARGPLHPVRKLPDEILREIFLAWRAADVDGCYRDNTVCVRASSVCRWWRRVALGLPHLWTQVTVRLSRIHPRNVDGWCTYLDTRRSRSGRIPLVCTVEAEGDGRGPSSAEFYVALKRCFTRAGSLSLVIEHFPALDRRLLACLDVDAPYLVKFSCTIGLARSYPLDWTVPFFRSAPLLQRVNLDLLEGELAWPAQSTFPAVTAVHLDGTDAGVLLDIFHHMPNLSTLDLWEINLCADDLPEFSVHSEHLRALCLYIDEVCDDAIIRNMHFPALRVASLQVPRAANAAISLFLRYPMHTVEELTLDILDVSILDGLRYLDRLKELHIRRYTETSCAALQALSSPTADGSWLCPLLSRVVLPSLNETVEELLACGVSEFAQARGPHARSNGRPREHLRQLEIESQGRWDAKITELLADIKRFLDPNSSDSGQGSSSP